MEDIVRSSTPYTRPSLSIDGQPARRPAGFATTIRSSVSPSKLYRNSLPARFNLGSSFDSLNKSLRNVETPRCILYSLACFFALLFFAYVFVSKSKTIDKGFMVVRGLF